MTEKQEASELENISENEARRLSANEIRRKMAWKKMRIFLYSIILPAEIAVCLYTYRDKIPIDYDKLAIENIAPKVSLVEASYPKEQTISE